MASQTALTRSPELTRTAFVKHMQNLISSYNRLLCVNLLAKETKHEQLITKAYEEQIKISKLEAVRYEYFDFHKENKKNENICPFLKKLNLIHESFKFFAEDLTKKKVHMKQKGRGFKLG